MIKREKRDIRVINIFYKGIVLTIMSLILTDLPLFCTPITESSSSEPNKEVSIPDFVLESAIKEVVDKPEEPIFSFDLDTMTEL